MLIHPEERNHLVMPYDDYEPGTAVLEEPTEPAVEDLVERMTADARETCDKVGVRAAMATVIAVGNYEYVSFRRPRIIEAAQALLDEIDPSGKETRRWGP